MPFGKLIRAVACAAVITSGIGLVTPAMAQRGIQADGSDDDEPSQRVNDFGLCTLGTTGCGGFQVEFPPTYAGSIGGQDYGIQYFSTQTIFIYAEGVVSFGEELPEGASVAGGLASLGTGNWFAPGFGGATEVTVFDDSLTGHEVKFRINWGPGVGSAPPTEVDKVLFQLTLGQFEEDPLVAVFGFQSGYPGGHGAVAYNYAPFAASPGTPPGTIQTSPISAYDLRFSGHEVLASAPEPSSWAVMLLGFGLAGTALRRRHGFPFAKRGLRRSA
jgi:hypothetical protein